MMLNFKSVHTWGVSSLRNYIYDVCTNGFFKLKTHYKNNHKQNLYKHRKIYYYSSYLIQRVKEMFSITQAEQLEDLLGEG